MSEFLKRLARLDKPLLFLCLGLSACGLTALYGVTRSFLDSPRALMVQGGVTVLGLCCMAFFACADYHRLAQLWKIHVPVTLALTLLTFVAGYGRVGADDKAWLSFYGVGMQPSEFLKLSFILTYALHLSAVKERINMPGTLALLLLHGAAPALLIHFQGDDGTALVLAVMAAVMLFCAGLSLKWMGTLLGLCAASLPALWFLVLNEDQKNRVLVLLRPGAEDLAAISYQQTQGVEAFRNGGLFGIGLLNGGHTYVPEVKNDFILAFIGESFGFAGCLLVLGLLFCLLLRTAFLAAKAEDKLGSLIAVGVLAMLGCQSVLNVGMCLMVLPVIGVTLPFLSAGGSSLLSTYIAMGLLMSVKACGSVAAGKGESAK